MKIYKINDKIRFIWDAPMYDMPGFSIRFFSFYFAWSFKGQVAWWCGKFTLSIFNWKYCPKLGWEKMN
jgi:hypothetical protein